MKKYSLDELNRTVQENGALNIMDFGAIREDGSDTPFDCAEAMQACLTKAGELGSAMYIPSGEFSCGAQLTGNMEKNIAIIGDGADISVINFTNVDSCGIDITTPKATLAPSRGESTFRDFSLRKNTGISVPYDGVSGTALKVMGRQDAQVGLTAENNFTFMNINVGTKKGSSKYDAWNAGIHSGRIDDPVVVEGGGKTNFINCHANGCPWTFDEGITSTGAAFVFDTAIGSKMTMCHAYNFEYGVHVIGATEGPDINMGGFVGVGYGVYSDTIKQEPGFVVANCHINAYKGGIVAYKRNAITITGCLMYQRLNSEETPYYHMNLRSTWDATAGDWEKNSFAVITGNVFASSKYGNEGEPWETIAIRIGEGTLTSIIANNIIRWCSTGIILEVDSEYMQVHDNDTSGTPMQIENKQVVPNTHSNVSTLKQNSFFNVELTANQTISTNVHTKVVSWGNTYNSGASGFSGDEFVIQQGTTAVKVTANIEFAGAVGGKREIRFRKNGLDTMYLPRSTVASLDTTTGLILNIASGAIPVEEGDVIELVVLQTTGLDLDIVVGTSSWMSLEVIS